MRRKRPHILSIGLLVYLLLLILGPFLAAQAAESTSKEDAHYRVVETEDLRLLYYDEEHSYVVPHLARCFENAFGFHKRLFGYTPSGEVTVQLQDFDDHGYAGTTTIPYNFVTIGIEPFEYVYDTCPTNERMSWVMNHELVHVVCCDQAAGADNLFRTIFFGKVAPTDEDPPSIIYSYLTNPRYYSPRWYHEGIAVFLETWMSGGIGRAQNGYDEMVFRTMVRDGSYFYDIVGLESEGTTIDFQMGHNSYLYGTRFVSYLAFLYGPEKVLEWFKRTPGSKRYFASQFRHVFGTPLDEEWSNWVRWEHDWQKTNLDSIQQFPITPYRVLSDRELGSVSRAFYAPDRRKLYVGVQYPGDFSHIAEIDVVTGESRKLCDVTTPAPYYVTFLAADDARSRLFFTTDNSRRWRDLNVMDLVTGETHRLVENARAGDLAFNPVDRSVWAVQHHAGKSRLIRFPEPYETWQEFLVFRYGKDIFDIDVSPDGRFITASLVEVSGRQRLIRIAMDDIVSLSADYEVLWEFADNAPANFVHSPDGRYLFGTTYYTGASNVFRYDFEKRTMEALTNAETGFFRPVPVSEDSLIAFTYTGDGFVPVMIPNQPIEDVSPIRYLGTAIVDAHPIVRDWILGSPAAVNIDSLTVASGNYGALGNIRLASAYPIVEGYKDYPAYGMRFNFIDPGWLHGLDAAVSYTPNEGLPDDERLHARLRYRYAQWTLDGAYNRADFYDLFGPTKISRRGYSLGLSFAGRFIDDPPTSFRYTLAASGYWDLERLPDAQNIATSYDHFYTGDAQLAYSRLNTTIGAVEPEKGLVAKLALNNTYVRQEHYPRVRADLTYGFLTPIEHSSIWLRTSLGYSPGDDDEPFANFYFGGFGNNWVDHGTINRYRSYYSFPGVPLNAIPGTNYAKAQVEWTLPPIRFRRLGFPALYCNWTRLSLFSTGIVTNLHRDDFYRCELANVGAQMNFKLVLFSSLQSTLSLGYAFAFEEGWKPEDEYVISLRILR